MFDEVGSKRDSKITTYFAPMGHKKQFCIAFGRALQQNKRGKRIHTSSTPSLVQQLERPLEQR
jgi:hypothetical protein